MNEPLRGMDLVYYGIVCMGDSLGSAWSSLDKGESLGFHSTKSLLLNGEASDPSLSTELHG